MRVGLIGFGKAGRAAASVLLESRFSHLAWVLRASNVLQHRSVPEFLGVDSDEPGLIYSFKDWDIEQLLDQQPVDAIVDFGAEEAIFWYGQAAASRGISIVSAVSQYPQAQQAFLQSLAQQTRVCWSPNITIGINFLLMAGAVLQQIAPYVDVEVLEEHFKTKPEISGTAKVLANKFNIPHDQIKSVRAGGIIGRHELIFGFPYQTLRLTHDAVSREAFGKGALFALENIEQHPIGQVLSMEDLLRPYFDAAANVKVK